MNEAAQQTHHVNICKRRQGHARNRDIGFFAGHNVGTMCFANIGAIPLCGSIPVPGYRLDKALNGTQRIPAPISKDSPPFFNMFPAIVTVSCSPFIFARLGVIFDGWVITRFASPWT